MSLGPVPLNMYFGIVVGFFATVVVASALNRFGDEMFRRGVASPSSSLGTGFITGASFSSVFR